MAVLVTHKMEEERKRIYEGGLTMRDVAQVSGFGVTCVREYLD